MLPPSNCGVLILGVVVFECLLQQVFPPCLRHFSLVTTLLFTATCFRFQPCRQQLHTEISSSVYFRNWVFFGGSGGGLLSEALNLNTKVRFGAARYLLSSAFVLYCLMRWVWSLRALVAVLCLLLQGPRNTLFHLCSPSLTGALAWNADQLSSGSRDRMILQRDIRTPPLQSERRLQGHRQEVCGLKWSTDHQLLASGGNDNKVQCSVLLTRGSASLHPHQDLSHPPPSFKLQCGAFNCWAVSNCTSQ